jgi:hypothetical protein
MAVISEVPGLRVEIYVRGRAVEEYDDESAENRLKTVTKFIEAIFGSEFKVVIYFTPPFSDEDEIMPTVETDGKVVHRSSCEAGRICSSSPHILPYAVFCRRWRSACVQASFCGTHSQ